MSEPSIYQLLQTYGPLAFGALLAFVIKDLYAAVVKLQKWGWLVGLVAGVLAVLLWQKLPYIVSRL